MTYISLVPRLRSSAVTESTAKRPYPLPCSSAAEADRAVAVHDQPGPGETGSVDVRLGEGVGHRLDRVFLVGADANGESGFEIPGRYLFQMMRSWMSSRISSHPRTLSSSMTAQPRNSGAPDHPNCRYRPRKCISGPPSALGTRAVSTRPMTSVWSPAVTRCSVRHSRVASAPPTSGAPEASPRM